MPGSHHLTLFIFLLVPSQLVLCTGHRVIIANNGPVVLGANITFVAKILDEHGDTPSGPFLFYWTDDATPQHKSIYLGDSPLTKWTVNYPGSLYDPGQYVVSLHVHTYSMGDWGLPRGDYAEFNVTMPKNSLSSEYISTAEEHNIKLSQSDYDYMAKNATSVLTYWFIDCVYFGSTTNYMFTHTYNTAGEMYNIEALVVTSYEPISHPKIAQSIKKTDESNGSIDLYNGSLPIPFSCHNQTEVLIDKKKTYGYFQRTLLTRDPVSNLSINGNNWLQQGDMLVLLVKCRGSPPYEYCAEFRHGLYNVTGNETCRYPIQTQTCGFTVVQYFPIFDIYTVVIIVYNKLNKVVSPVTVHFYQDMTHAKLPLGLVLISFGIIAAVLIVFGAAYYYKQRRSHHSENLRLARLAPSCESASA